MEKSEAIDGLKKVKELLSEHVYLLKTEDGEDNRFIHDSDFFKSRCRELNAFFPIFKDVCEYVISTDDKKTADRVNETGEAFDVLLKMQPEIYTLNVKFYGCDEIGWSVKFVIAYHNYFKELLKFQRLATIVKEELSTKQADVKKTAGRRNKTFADLIQYEDKEKLLKRLHSLIDNHSGADVGAVLLRCYSIDHYITHCPTRAEYESEFKLIGGWNAIHNYLSENNQNALDRANRIEIFN